jgi:hypothetical protein
MPELLKLTGVGALYYLIWTMIVTKISTFATSIYNDLTNQDFVDFLQMSLCRKWWLQVKEENSNHYQ